MERQPTPSESELEKREKTEYILQLIKSFEIEGSQYAITSLIHEYTSSICLQSPEGYKVLVDKARAGFVPTKGDYYQGLAISVHSGNDSKADFKQIDYNFDQQDDWQFRKRVIGKNELRSQQTFIDPSQTPEQLYDATLQMVREEVNIAENRRLEESFGLTNQPLTLRELDELSRLLRESILLDPRNDFKPVQQ